MGQVLKLQLLATPLPPCTFQRPQSVADPAKPDRDAQRVCLFPGLVWADTWEGGAFHIWVNVG